MAFKIPKVQSADVETILKQQFIISPTAPTTLTNNWVKIFEHGPSKICLPQILLGLFLNTLTQLTLLNKLRSIDTQI